MVILLRALVLAGAAILVWYIGWSVSEPFWPAVDQITALRWGQTTLVDLYLGFVIGMILVFIVERKLWLAAIWALPIPFLGNFWLAFWFVWRLPKILKQVGNS